MAKRPLRIKRVAHIVHVGTLTMLSIPTSGQMVDDVAAERAYADGKQTESDAPMSNSWASENTHFYYSDGRPCTSIVGKNGKERAPDIRDARRLSLVPGATRIIRSAHSYTLERWKAEQLLLAGLTLPRIDGELEADWIKRVWEDSQQQAIKAAERGVAIHAAIESYYRAADAAAVTANVPDEWAPWVYAVEGTIRLTFGDPKWNTEKSFATDSYGGKVDLHAPGLVLDIKTKDGGLSDVKIYDEHCMQLAAYAHGLGMCNYIGLQAPPRAGIVFVSRTEPRAVVCELTAADLERGWQMFSALLRYWQAANRMEA